MCVPDTPSRYFCVMALSMICSLRAVGTLVGHSFLFLEFLDITQVLALLAPVLSLSVGTGCGALLSRGSLGVFQG